MAVKAPMFFRALVLCCIFLVQLACLGGVWEPSLFLPPRFPGLLPVVYRTLVAPRLQRCTARPTAPRETKREREREGTKQRTGNEGESEEPLDMITSTSARGRRGLKEQQSRGDGGKLRYFLGAARHLKHRLAGGDGTPRN